MPRFEDRHAAGSREPGMDSTRAASRFEGILPPCTSTDNSSRSYHISAKNEMLKSANILLLQAATAVFVGDSENYLFFQ